MDLIHADGNFTELGVVDFVRYDGVLSLEPGVQGNDWEAEIPAEDFSRYGFALVHYLYFPGSEFGGDSRRSKRFPRRTPSNSAA